MSAGARTGMVIAVVAVGVVVAAIVAGLRSVDPPAVERLERYDQQRRSDLKKISSAVQGYWEGEDRLPESVEELTAVARWRELRITDPLTEERYEYSPRGERAYELCATFERKAERGNLEVGDRWWHGEGRQCFEREVEPPRSPR